MPLYEYRCEEDGTTITLMRPMAEADKAVKDPQKKGRKFRRVHSTFNVGPGGSSSPASGGTCPTCNLDGTCGL